MARITVEDCAEVVSNRFELVVLSSHRAKLISSGSHILVERDNDKNAVVALREIGDKKLDVEHLREMTIQNFQKRLPKEVILDDGEEVTEIDTELAMEISKELTQEIEEISDDMNLGSFEGSSDEGTSFAEDNLDVDD